MTSHVQQADLEGLSTMSGSGKGPASTWACRRGSKETGTELTWDQAVRSAAAICRSLVLPSRENMGIREEGRAREESGSWLKLLDLLLTQPLQIPPHPTQEDRQASAQVDTWVLSRLRTLNTVQAEPPPSPRLPAQAPLPTSLSYLPQARRELSP